MRTLKVLLFFLIAPVLLAQDTRPMLRWFGEIRIRGEADMRDFRSRTPGNAYTLLRTRFGAEANPIENVRVVLQVSDSRVFGQERDGTGAFNTLADSRNLDLHQGFVEIRKFLGDDITLKLGRQELNYGNERILGGVGWHNVGRSFDGGLLRLEGAEMTVDALVMTLAEVQTYAAVATPAAVQYVRDGGSDLYGLYGTIKSIPDNLVDAYFLYQTDRNQTAVGFNDLERWTAGGLLRGKAAPFQYDVEAAYQGGKRRGAEVSAYLLSGSLNYLFEDSPLKRLGVGYDFLSGTKAGSSKHGSFDPMFHTGHKFYGFMDYFIGFPANTADRGLIDMFARATVNFTQSLASNIWVHSFRPDTDARQLGQELDWVVSYKMNEAVSLDAGISAFLPGVVMRERFGGASTGFWGFLALTTSF